MYVWQSNLASAEERDGKQLKAGEKETIKQHVIELLDSFTRSSNQNQADQMSVLPSPDYMEALANAVAEKLKPLITSSGTASMLSSSLKTECPSCPKCKLSTANDEFSQTQMMTQKTQKNSNFGGAAKVYSSLSVSGLETMQEIGFRTGTDKVRHHGYHRFYPLFLEGIRQKNLNENTKIKMFEIGYLQGESFRMWKDYFKGADIYFMEKDRQGPDSPHYHEKEGFYGDQVA